MANQLRRVIAHAVPRVIAGSNGTPTYCGTQDELECGHKVHNDGANVRERRCPECGPSGTDHLQPTLSAPAERDQDWRLSFFDNLVIDGKCPDCKGDVLVARDGSMACSNILCRFAHGGLK